MKSLLILLLLVFQQLPHSSDEELIALGKTSYAILNNKDSIYYLLPDDTIYVYVNTNMHPDVSQLKNIPKYGLAKYNWNFEELDLIVHKVIYEKESYGVYAKIQYENDSFRIVFDYYYLESEPRWKLEAIRINSELPEYIKFK